MYKDLPEFELLNLIKKDDYNAFDEIYDRHSSSLYGAAYNILRDKESCMDILQDIFAWFWEHRQKWELSSCKGYLLTAVKFKTANYIRNTNFRSSFFQELSSIKALNEQHSDGIEVQQLLSLIQSITDQLPERCREIFNLSRRQYLSNKEIAAKLNISEKTVENQMTIALKKLRGKLGNNYLIFIFFL